MNILSLLSAARLASETAEPAEPGFFQKIWNSLVSWFITDHGWMKVVAAVAVIVIGFLVLKIVMAIFKKIVN